MRTLGDSKASDSHCIHNNFYNKQEYRDSKFRTIQETGTPHKTSANEQGGGSEGAADENKKEEIASSDADDAIQEALALLRNLEEDQSQSDDRVSTAISAFDDTDGQIEGILGVEVMVSFMDLVEDHKALADGRAPDGIVKEENIKDDSDPESAQIQILTDESNRKEPQSLETAETDEANIALPVALASEYAEELRSE